MNGNKNVVKEKKKQKVNAVIYDKANIVEIVKLLNLIKVEGIEQCALMTDVARRLNSCIKEEEIEVEIEM